MAVLLDKIASTSRLVSGFEEFNNRHKYNILMRIKYNMDIIEKKIEKLGGLSETLKQAGSSNVSWMKESFNDIKSFLNTKKDLLAEAQAIAEARKARRKPKPVAALEVNTNNFTGYKSIHAAYKDLGVNPGQIKMCCEGTNNVKTGLSKRNGKRYTFYYARFINLKIFSKYNI